MLKTDNMQMAESFHHSGLTLPEFERISSGLKLAEARLKSGDPLSEEVKQYGVFAPSAYLLRLASSRSSNSPELRNNIAVLSAWAIREALRNLADSEASRIAQEGMTFRRAFGFNERLYQDQYSV